MSAAAPPCALAAAGERRRSPLQADRRGRASSDGKKPGHDIHTRFLYVYMTDSGSMYAGGVENGMDEGETEL